MSGFVIKQKTQDGSFIDIDLVAKYDSEGHEVVSHYATKDDLNGVVGQPGPEGPPGERGTKWFTVNINIGSTSGQTSTIVFPEAEIGDFLISTHFNSSQVYAQVIGKDGDNVTIKTSGSIKGPKGDTGAAGKDGTQVTVSDNSDGTVDLTIVT